VQGTGFNPIFSSIHIIRSNPCKKKGKEEYIASELISQKKEREKVSKTEDDDGGGVGEGNRDNKVWTFN
jgi:hypothetical protein